MSPAIQEDPSSVRCADRIGPEAIEPPENVRILGGKTEVSPEKVTGAKKQVRRQTRAEKNGFTKRGTRHANVASGEMKNTSDSDIRYSEISARLGDVEHVLQQMGRELNYVRKFSDIALLKDRSIVVHVISWPLKNEGRQREGSVRYRVVDLLLKVEKRNMQLSEGYFAWQNDRTGVPHGAGTRPSLVEFAYSIHKYRN